ncbi:amidohydrolase [Candidatus Bathyarchaeota archaeon]|nr:MAG: amidohydrolase [Candidatus Bathyarchaeota archaeon]
MHRIIDAHVHLFSGKRFNVNEELIRQADINGIEWLCVSSLGRVWSYTPPLERCIEANNDVLRFMSLHPNRVLGWCYINPREEGAIQEIERCIKAGMIGIKLWVACKACEPPVFRVIEKAIELDVPVLQHSWFKATGNLPHESTPNDVKILAERYPEAKIIMAHLGGDWELGLKAVRKCENVYVDTSGNYPEMGMIEAAVNELGAERVVFGSDAPGRNFCVEISKIMAADINQKDRELILRGNMLRLLGGRIR